MSVIDGPLLYFDYGDLDALRAIGWRREEKRSDFYTRREEQAELVRALGADCFKPPTSKSSARQTAPPAQAEHLQDDRGGRAERQDRHQHHHARRRDVALRQGRTHRGEQSVARRSQGDEAMKLPKYVQAWVDRDGRARCYFRRRGYP